MRAAYGNTLDNFSHDLIVMCDTVRDIMDKASLALLQGALDSAEDALTMTRKSDGKSALGVLNVP